MIKDILLAVMLMTACAAVYVAQHQREMYELERARVSVLTDMALKRERMIEAQAKQLQQRPVVFRVKYKTLP